MQLEPHRTGRGRRRNGEARDDALAPFEDVELVFGESELVTARRGVVELGGWPVCGRRDGERRRDEVVVGRNVRLKMPSGGDIEPRRHPDRLAREIGRVIGGGTEDDFLEARRRAAGSRRARRAELCPARAGRKRRRDEDADAAGAGALQEHWAVLSDFRVE